MLKFSSVALAALVLPLSFAMAQAQPIRIVSATYGTLQTGRVCDATPAVAGLCSGQSRCDVNIQNALCGDPDFLVVKQSQIRYRCGRSMRSVVVGEYTTATIACD